VVVFALMQVGKKWLYVDQYFFTPVQSY